MYLAYVDESGDPGLKNSPSRFFILTAFIVHSSKWREVLDELILFRKEIKKDYGLKLMEEIHAAAFISRTDAQLNSRIPKWRRLEILRKYAYELADLGKHGVEIIGVVVDKNGKPSDYEVFEMAWKALIQRVENTLERGNFAALRIPNQQGSIIPDRTDSKKLLRLLRAMRRYNVIPPRADDSESRPTDKPLRLIIEDPYIKDSKDSYFIQSADLCSFLLHQYCQPCRYIRFKGATKLYTSLGPIICKVVTNKDPILGIVKI